MSKDRGFSHIFSLTIISGRKQYYYHFTDKEIKSQKACGNNQNLYSDQSEYKNLNSISKTVFTLDLGIYIFKK